MNWPLYNLVDVIESALVNLTARTQSKLDDVVVLLIRKTLRIFLVVIFCCFWLKMSLD